MQSQGSSCQCEHANLNMQRTGGFQSETEREAILRATICVRVAQCGQSREIPYVTRSPAGYSTLVAVCCCYLFTKGLRNEKIELGLQCQGRRGDILASLGPSNEQTSCHSACVCVCLPSARRYVHICWITVVHWALDHHGTMWCGGRDGPQSFQWQVWTTDITDTPLHKLTSWLGTSLEIKVTC